MPKVIALDRPTGGDAAGSRRGARPGQGPGPAAGCARRPPAGENPTPAPPVRRVRGAPRPPRRDQGKCRATGPAGDRVATAPRPGRDGAGTRGRAAVLAQEEFRWRIRCAVPGPWWPAGGRGARRAGGKRVRRRAWRTEVRKSGRHDEYGSHRRHRTGGRWAATWPATSPGTATPSRVHNRTRPGPTRWSRSSATRATFVPAETAEEFVAVAGAAPAPGDHGQGRRARPTR